MAPPCPGERVVQPDSLSASLLHGHDETVAGATLRVNRRARPWAAKQGPEPCWVQ